MSGVVLRRHQDGRGRRRPPRLELSGLGLERRHDLPDARGGHALVIGLGLKPPAPTWGGMIREGFETLLDSPWLAIVPSLAILLVVFGFNLLGDGLRDAVDPKLRDEA